MKSRAAIFLGVLLLGGFVYFAGDLIANNASFFAPPGPWKRMTVYLTMHSAWTSSDYPLPEVGAQDYMGVPAKVREDILAGIKHFGSWKVVSDTGSLPGSPEILEIFVPGNFWRSSERLTLTMISDKYGIQLMAKSDSTALHADFGATRNTILRLFHAIENQIAIHPPV